MSQIYMDFSNTYQFSYQERRPIISNVRQSKNGVVHRVYPSLAKNRDEYAVVTVRMSRHNTSCAQATTAIYVAESWCTTPSFIAENGTIPIERVLSPALMEGL